MANDAVRLVNQLSFPEQCVAGILCLVAAGLVLYVIVEVRRLFTNAGAALLIGNQDDDPDQIDAEVAAAVELTVRTPLAFPVVTAESIARAKAYQRDARIAAGLDVETGRPVPTLSGPAAKGFYRDAATQERRASLHAIQSRRQA